MSPLRPASSLPAVLTGSRVRLHLFSGAAWAKLSNRSPSVNCARKFLVERNNTEETSVWAVTERKWVAVVRSDGSCNLRAGELRCQSGRVELFRNVPGRRGFGVYASKWLCVRVVVSRPVSTTVGRVGRGVTTGSRCVIIVSRRERGYVRG